MLRPSQVAEMDPHPSFAEIRSEQDLDSPIDQWAEL